MTKRKSSKHTQAHANTPARGASTKVRVRDVTAEPPQIPSVDASPAPKPTKQALILGLLERPEGASLADLVAATGWLPHTTRGPNAATPSRPRPRQDHRRGSLRITRSLATPNRAASLVNDMESGLIVRDVEGSVVRHGTLQQRSGRGHQTSSLPAEHHCRARPYGSRSPHVQGFEPWTR